MTTPTFHAAAISRLDGGVADGIHLLFEAPAPAGHSIDGFDIQRRSTPDKRERRCVTLTPDEIAVLNEQLAVSYEYGLVELRWGPGPHPLAARPPPDPERVCVRFGRRTNPSLGPNPVKLDGATFTVFSEQGRPSDATSLLMRPGTTGLDGEAALQIDLPAGAGAVEIGLFATGGASVELTTADGDATLELKAGRREQTVTLQERGVSSIRVSRTDGVLALASICWTPEPAPVAPPRPPLTHIAGPRNGPIYDFTFPELRDDVRITLDVPIELAIAFRQGHAVATASGAVAADFARRRADRVLVYTAEPASAIQVCVAEPQDELSWAHATTIATNVNFPVRAVNAALGSSADEQTLAKARLLAGEAYDQTAFTEVVRVLNDAAQVDPNVAPVWATTLTRKDVAEDFVEVRSWAYGTLPRLNAQWRRMLGLGYLDVGKNLIEGGAYDYRIIGRFRRRDVAERLLGFQTVPLGATLPHTIALGDVMLTLPQERSVRMTPAAGPADLELTGRKGIVLEDTGAGCLRIQLPSPVTQIALDVDPGHSLMYSATSTSVLTGPPPARFAGVVPAQAHAVLDFAAAVDTILLEGKGMFYGLRVGSDPTANPDDVLTVTEEITGVVYERTPPPAPPTLVGAENLQKPPVVAPASGQPPPRPLGFNVSWLPPGGVTAWPPDLAAAPPFDVMSFGIERCRVDTNGAWQEISADTAFFGSRGAQAAPLVLSPGCDLLSVFPEWRPPHPPVSPLMQVEDQLERTGGVDPPPGSTHRYRVHAVDAIGRVSAPGLSPVSRLEKHVPPPQPAGRQDIPPDIPPDVTPQPTGVTARVLQRTDPALPAADVARLGAAATAVVIEWGWTDEQRARDPYATEFRVYWDSTPPDVIDGELSGIATASTASWTIDATMGRSVLSDALAGRYIQAGERPFLVTSNSSGTAISIVLARSAVEPAAVPTAGAFVFQPALDGSELRPGGWERRSAIVPLTAADTYRHVFAETVTLDASHPRARVWAGVSAADAQSYVADELTAGAQNGGRPGNESSIVPAPANAHWIGRPAFTHTEPLPDVPEQRTNEPVGDDVRTVVDLPSLLAGIAIPAGHLLFVERLALSEVVAALSATAADTIHVQPPEGSGAEYDLTDAGDRAALLAQIRSGVPAMVERRFLMDVLLEMSEGFDTSWMPAVGGHVANAPLELTLAADAERYAVRVRVVDAAGHISAESAVLGLVLRVPSLRTPAPPVLTVDADASDAVTVSARARDVPDLHSMLFFSTPMAGASAPTGELLRTPNRPDLYPNSGVRLRLADGKLLAPSVVAASAGVSEVADRILTTSLVAGYGLQVAVWAATLTRDGVPSRLAGPSVAATGPPPLVVPGLAVTVAGVEDQAAWSTPSVPAETALERSDDGGPWAQVSPWLPPAVTTYVLPGGATRSYRLVLRADRDRHATGPEVTPT